MTSHSLLGSAIPANGPFLLGHFQIRCFYVSKARRIRFRYYLKLAFSMKKRARGLNAISFGPYWMCFRPGLSCIRWAFVGKFFFLVEFSREHCGGRHRGCGLFHIPRQEP